MRGYNKFDDWFLLYWDTTTYSQSAVLYVCHLTVPAAIGPDGLEELDPEVWANCPNESDCEAPGVL